MVSERKHFQPPFNPSLYPKPTSATVRIFPKPGRDDRFGRANRNNNINRPKGDYNRPRNHFSARNYCKSLLDSKGLCSFYVTNFPEKWNSKDLMEIFSRYGQVKDVMIPDKRNKMGWKYAYARFQGCNSSHDLERVLDSIWIGSYKIRVNVSKYSEQVVRLAAKVQKEGRVLRPALRKENTSFRDALRTERSNANTEAAQEATILNPGKLGNVKITPQVSIVGSTRKYTIGKKESNWLSDAIVGMAKDPEGWLEAGNELKDMGYKNVHISPLNSHAWLIFGEDLSKKVFFTIEEEQWLKEKFISWHQWDFYDGISERITWVQIIGISLNLWNESFIQWILADEGTIVEVEVSTRQRKRLECARVKLRTDSFRLIQKSIRCQFEDRNFYVSIIEIADPFSVTSAKSAHDTSMVGDPFKLSPESEDISPESGDSRVVESIQQVTEGETLFGKEIAINGRVNLELNGLDNQELKSPNPLEFPINPAIMDPIPDTPHIGYDALEVDSMRAVNYENVGGHFENDTPDAISLAQLVISPTLNIQTGGPNPKKFNSSPQ